MSCWNNGPTFSGLGRDQVLTGSYWGSAQNVSTRMPFGSGALESLTCATHEWTHVLTKCCLGRAGLFVLGGRVGELLARAAAI